MNYIIILEDRDKKSSADLESVEFTYYGQVYNGEKKTITIAYMLCGKSGNSYKVKNFQEIVSDTAVGLDNRIPYFVQVHTTYLPISNCNIVGDVNNMPNFKYIEIPYWIYKKNYDALVPKRIEDHRTRGQFFVPIPYRNDKYFNILKDEENQIGINIIGIPKVEYEHYLK